MRIRLAVGLIAAAALAGTYIRYYPPAPEIRTEDQPAQVVSVTRWSEDGDWFGGLSGLELAADGREFYAITDRATLITGRFRRDEDDVIIGVETLDHKELTGPDGEELTENRTDSEGLALAPDGTLYISFEHVHRVWKYDTPQADPVWPSYARAWRALSRNGGLEMLALRDDGTLVAIPEQAGHRASEGLVYIRRPKRRWTQPTMLRLDERFRPVGGDFGPDGRLYLLERDVYPFGFRSRVRALEMTGNKITSSKVVFQSRLGSFGNLEGLSAWRDGKGRIRLTLVADDNFLPIQRSHVVELVLTP